MSEVENKKLQRLYQTGIVKTVSLLQKLGESSFSNIVMLYEASTGCVIQIAIANFFLIFK